MPGITFLEYDAVLHDKIRLEIEDIKEEYEQKIKQFNEKIYKRAADKSYFLESIGLARYDISQKVEWEKNKVKCKNAPGYINSHLTIGNAWVDDQSVYNEYPELETLEDIERKVKALRDTIARSATLDKDELKILEKHVEF